MYQREESMIKSQSIPWAWGDNIGKSLWALSRNAQIAQERRHGFAELLGRVDRCRCS
jgi:hypothetical protein